MLITPVGRIKEANGRTVEHVVGPLEAVKKMKNRCLCSLPHAVVCGSTR